jgi:hypothetical protein
MLPDNSSLSSTVIIAAARETLAASGFRVSSEHGLTALEPDRSLLAEDYRARRVRHLDGAPS